MNNSDRGFSRDQLRPSGLLRKAREMDTKSIVKWSAIGLGAVAVGTVGVIAVKNPALLVKGAQATKAVAAPLAKSSVEAVKKVATSDATKAYLIQTAKIHVAKSATVSLVLVSVKGVFLNATSKALKEIGLDELPEGLKDRIPEKYRDGEIPVYTAKVFLKDWVKTTAQFLVDPTTIVFSFARGARAVGMAKKVYVPIYVAGWGTLITHTAINFKVQASKLTTEAEYFANGHEKKGFNVFLTVNSKVGLAKARRQSRKVRKDPKAEVGMENVWAKYLRPYIETHGEQRLSEVLVETQDYGFMTESDAEELAKFYVEQVPPTKHHLAVYNIVKGDLGHVNDDLHQEAAKMLAHAVQAEFLRR